MKRISTFPISKIGFCAFFLLCSTILSSCSEKRQLQLAPNTTAAVLSVLTGTTEEFGSVLLEEVIETRISIKNTGFQAAKIEASEFSPNAGPFSFVGGAYPGTGGSCGPTVEMGEICDLVIQFIPDEIATHQRLMNISYDNGYFINILSIPLRGEGYTPGQLAIEGGPEINFPITPRGTTERVSFTLSNSGSRPAEISQVSITPPNGAFTFLGGAFPGTNGTCLMTIDGFSSCSVEIVFTPSSAIPFEEALAINYQDSLGPQTLVVDLLGEGTQLDLSFGTEGVTRTPAMSSNDILHGLGLSPIDGSIITGGKIYIDTDQGLKRALFLRRYSSEGVLDTNFNNNTGAVIDTLEETESDSKLTELLVQPSGDIVGVGTTNDNTRGIIVRYLANGTRDPDFADGGLKIFMEGTTSGFHGIALQSAGKIVAVGNRKPSGSNIPFMTAFRVHADGTDDVTFDEDAKQTIDTGLDNAIALAVKIQPDGKILMVGYGTDPNSGNGADVVLVRLNGDDGSLDPSFGQDVDGDGDVDGVMHVPDLGFQRNDYGFDLALQSDGKIIVSGYISISSDPRIRRGFVLRLFSNGSVDTSFGDNGKIVIDAGSQVRMPSLAVDEDNNILITGEINARARLWRYLPNGAPDSSFGVDGVLRVPFGNEYSQGTVLKIDSNGKIVVAGYCYQGGIEHHCLARFVP